MHIYFSDFWIAVLIHRVTTFTPESCSWQLFKVPCFQQKLLILTFYLQPFGSVDIWLALEFTIRRQLLLLRSYNICWTNSYEIFQNVIIFSWGKDKKDLLSNKSFLQSSALAEHKRLEWKIWAICIIDVAVVST